MALTIPKNANSTNNFGITNFIVDPIPGLGTHTTIANAMSQSSVGTTIWVRPGTYSEDFDLVDGVNIQAVKSQARQLSAGGITGAIISGTMTATGGTSTITGCVIETINTNSLVMNPGPNSNVAFYDCFFNVETGNTAIVCSNSGSVVRLNCCEGTGNGALFNITAISAYVLHSGLTLFYCSFYNTGLSSTASTIAAGQLTIINTLFSSPISTTGTAFFYALNSSFINQISSKVLILAGSGFHILELCDLSAGAAPPLDVTNTTTISNCVIKTTNSTAISGAGTVNLSEVAFSGTGSTVVPTIIPKDVRIGTLYLTTPLGTASGGTGNSTNNQYTITTPASYPYTTLSSDQVILVDTSSARTIIPMASPITGQRHIIKDSVGSAATNNITISPSGKNIDGAASSTINIAYGSITIVYSGTQWLII